MSSSTTGTTPRANVMNSGSEPYFLPRAAYGNRALTPISSSPRVGVLGGGDARVVARRDAPLVGAAGRPLPILGTADLVVVADFLDLRGVFDDAAVRADEVAEDIVARPVATGTPHRRKAGVAHAPDAAHDTVDVGHLEGDVVERRDAAARVGDAVMHAVAAHEAHVACAIREAEAELLHGESLGRVRIPGIEDDVRELDGPVAICGQGRDRRLDDEAVERALRALAFALASDLRLAATERDAAQRRLAALERDDVGQPRRAAQADRVAIAGARKAPYLLEEAGAAFDIGDAQFDALQFHRPVTPWPQSAAACP